MPHIAVNGVVNGLHDGYDARFDVAARNAPITYSRVQAVNADDKLEKPNIARANAAVSSERPNGEPEQVKKYKDYVGFPFHLHAQHRAWLQ